MCVCVWGGGGGGWKGARGLGREYINTFRGNSPLYVIG